MPQRRRRAGLRPVRRVPGVPAAFTALALAATLLTGGAALADPIDDDDVAAAHAAVADASADVAQIEVRLAEQAAAVDEAWTAVEAAGEDYAGAIETRDRAAVAADAAADRAARANEQMEAARVELGRIAQEANRSSGGLSNVAALLSADGYEDYVARSGAIDQLGKRADRAVQTFEAAQLVSRTLSRQADEASTQAQDAADAAEDALAQAQQLQKAAEQKAAEVAAEREQLVARLAVLRQTSVEVEQARQAQIEADRKARADAAAQAGHPTSGTPSNPGTPSAPPSNPGTPSAPPSNPGTPSAPPTQPPTADPYGLGTGSQRGSAAQGEAAVAWAVAQVGKPYVWGATGPDSFDCSGLTGAAWHAAGVSIKRTSRDQYRQVLKITYDQMRPGDLIFWGDDPANPDSIHHVAMFTGGGQMVEASRPGVPVRVTAIRWAGTMPYAGRP